MPFRKYSSIENSYRQKEIDYIVRCGFNHTDYKWSVSEKVHGASFSFALVSGQDHIRMAKRTSLIADDANFYGSQIVWKRYKDNVKLLMDHLQKEYPDNKDFIIYGEIYGGWYPHDDVEKVPNATRVQKGVYYNPDNDFYAFDIRVDENFLDKDVANELFKKFGFFYAKPLFEGTFEECLEYNNKYITTIPKRLGLPEIADNFCEGNVIKPIKALTLPSGSRVILKNKNEIFNERSNKKVKIEIKMTDKMQEVFDLLCSYITENRLRNIISHVGPVSNKEFGKVMGEMSKDIYKDFNKDYADKLNDLEKKEQKRVKKIVGQKTADLIRKNFLDIIDGTF
ncbi:MAG: RNA ligase, Rnl2 family [Elusimicrobiota bacterium]